MRTSKSEVRNSVKKTKSEVRKSVKRACQKSVKRDLTERSYNKKRPGMELKETVMS
jgi:hypothetical protein